MKERNIVYKRYAYRRISHAIEHIENGDIDMALSLLKQAKRAEEKRIRDDDKR